MNAFLRASATLVCLFSAAATADDLPDVASAPRRMEIPAEQVAGAITIIGREEIERRQLRTLVDVLRYVPGVDVAQAGGPGKQTSVFTRGTESNHTLVLLDGIDISDPSSPDGGVDYAHLLTENVERIEVLRGPQSTLYGSDAIGGVINIVTRRGEGPVEFAGRAEAGGFGTAQHTASMLGRHGAVDYSLNYSSLHTRGITAVSQDLGAHERDDYDNRTVSGRIGIRPSDFARIDLIGRFVDSDAELDGFGSDEPDARSSNRQLFLRSQAELELLDGRFKPTIGVSFTDYDRKNPNGIGGFSASNSTQDGTRLKIDLQNDLFVGRGYVVTLGAETERDTYRSQSTSAFSAGLAHESVRNSAAYLQTQFSIADQFFGTAGVRLDHHDEFGSQQTYRLASAWVHPESGTRIRGSIATGFKAPALDELFGSTSFFTGNPNLEPERSRGWELGLEQPLFDGRVRLGLTYFQSHIRNLIEPTTFFDSLVNVGRARIDGFESFVELRAMEWARLRVDHTYTSAEAKEGMTAIPSKGNDLLRRPAHKISSVVELLPIEGMTLSGGVIYTGARSDIDAATFATTRKGGFTIVNLASTYEVMDGWKLFGRIDNLFDRKFDYPDGFESPGFAGYVGVQAAY